MLVGLRVGRCAASGLSDECGQVDSSRVRALTGAEQPRPPSSHHRRRSGDTGQAEGDGDDVAASALRAGRRRCQEVASARVSEREAASSRTDSVAGIWAGRVPPCRSYDIPAITDVQGNQSNGHCHRLHGRRVEAGRSALRLGRRVQLAAIVVNTGGRREGDRTSSAEIYASTTESPTGEPWVTRSRPNSLHHVLPVSL